MLDSTDLISGAEVRRLLGDISEKTLSRYRVHWHEGFHYVQPVHRIQYVKPMIVHWMLNRKSNPKAHDAEIKAWLTAKEKPTKRQ
jgi:hypothetical protein